MSADESNEWLPSIHSQDYAFEYLFPFPLADLFRRFRVSRHPVDKVGYLLSAAEASLKFLVAVSSGLVIPTTDLSDGLRDLGRATEAPSLGTWRRMLEIFSRASLRSPKADINVDLLRCIANTSGGESPYLRSVRTLVELRNDYIHGGTITSDAAMSLLPEVVTNLRGAFGELIFLTRYPFVITEEVHRLRFPQCFEVVVRRCQGSNPMFPYEVWRLTDPVDPGVPLLLSPDVSQAYRLHPIAAVFKDQRSQQSKCWFYLRRRPKAVWHSYEYGDQTSLEGAQALQDEMQMLLTGGLENQPIQLKFEGNHRPAWSRRFIETDKLDLPPGYQMLGEIGRGRYATVYKVLHVGLKEIRAVKVLLPEAALDGHVRRRFEIEAQILAQLRGKQVAIDVYEYGELPLGLPYLVLQYVEGGSLEEGMRRWGPKKASEVVDLGIACFRALGVIHEAGILHRDIKLSNILVDADRYLMCDFGVAKSEGAEALTLDGDAIGTVGYAPPEQLDGRWDVRSDIYSLGVCLTNLLAGQGLANPRRWLNQNVGDNLELRAAILSTIEAVGENRPPSAVAVAERLAGVKRRHELTVSSADAIPTEGIIAGTLQAEPAVMVGNHHRKWVSPDGTVFREIPSGEFLMGGTKYADERPVHRVEFRQPFLLASTLVTNRQFLEFCRATRYRGSHERFIFHVKRTVLPAPWRDPENPVVFVSWRDAKEYVLWRCERDDTDYRLPTEAEWEYGCRCGSRTVYPWGNLYDPAKLNADNIHGHPTPVGSYPPNEWGLRDMLGNVWEWCEDVKDVIPREESLFYRSCADGPEGTAIAPVNTGSSAIVSRRVAGGLRVVRGGSFFSEGRNFRPANRRGQHFEDCVRSIGFRLCAHKVSDAELRPVDAQ